MAAHEVLNFQLFHGSTVPADEFLKAPALHMADNYRESLSEVRQMARNDPSRRGETQIHGFNVSEHAKIEDEVFSDEVANRAHLLLLRRHGLFPSDSVVDSAAYYPSPESVRAFRHLKNNRIIKYQNGVTDGITFVVPSPHMNLYKEGDKDPQQQPVLPMDYSMTNPSERSKEELKKRRR